MTLPPVLPVGTSVVTRLPVAGHPAGAVAVIVRSPPDPEHAYRVRFPDGTEATLSRGGLTVRRHEKNALPETERDFTPFVQYRCVVGSRAFGLDTSDSDTDLRGFYLPPARDHWSLAGVPEQLEFGEEVYWEAGKFVLLALGANPNVLEVLHSPLVRTVTPLAAELLAMREAFLSRLVYQTYNGYVMGQFGRLEADLRQHGDTLLAVKRGEVPWAEVERWRLSLHADFDRAYAGTTLPERPDYARVEAWLLRARRAALDWE